MTTYTELVTQIRDYTETDSNVLTSVIVNDFIEHTENRILRDLDIPIFTSHQYSNFTASSGFLTLPGGSSLTPTEFSVINSVQIYTAVGAARTYLERKDVSYMNEYWPNRATEGTPKYYSQWDYNTIYVVPTPDAAYFSEVSLSKLPDRLTSSNATTWIGDNAPALILYGCLAEAFKFLKGPAEMLQLYEQSYQRAIQELMIEQQGRHRRDEYMHGALRTPLQSHNP